MFQLQGDMSENVHTELVKVWIDPNFYEKEQYILKPKISFLFDKEVSFTFK